MLNHPIETIPLMMETLCHVAGAFDRALIAAISQFKSRHGGKAPRVLDIGSGSGLLAMMAARAGASEVHSL